MSDIYNIPRISLACLPTPIRPLTRLSAMMPGTELFIKRDDLTGCTLSGNKARKLEYLLADAQEKKSTILLTCGGIQSNHARATAIAGRELGMKSLLLLRGEKPVLPEANLFLDLLSGAEIKYLTGEEYFQAPQTMAALAEELKKQGEVPYIIPEGGSCALGSLGYAMAIEEIKQQLQDTHLDYIVTAVGSGGTFAGLVMGCQLMNFPARVIGINVCASAAFFEKRVAKLIKEAKDTFDLPVCDAGGDWEIIDGYVGRGYAQTQPEELALLRMVAETEGIILDPVYTAKAFRGLWEEIKNERFGKNKKILFIHTGGTFGLLTSNYSAAFFNA